MEARLSVNIRNVNNVEHMETVNTSAEGASLVLILRQNLTLCCLKCYDGLNDVFIIKQAFLTLKTLYISKASGIRDCPMVFLDWPWVSYGVLGGPMVSCGNQMHPCPSDG